MGPKKRRSDLILWFISNGLPETRHTILTSPRGWPCWVFYVLHDVIDVEVLENSRTTAAVNILPSAVYNEASVALLLAWFLSYHFSKYFSRNNSLSTTNSPFSLHDTTLESAERKQ